MFEFDAMDSVARKEFQKPCLVAAITVSGLWIADVKVLNATKWGMAMGPLRKFALINICNLPVYWYFYTSVKQSH